MSTTRPTVRPRAARLPRAVGATVPAGWLRVGIAVGAVAWGANQFAPMLLVYQDRLGISTATAQATFGLYAIGLAPGLLLGGPVSDRRGRRVVLTFALGASLLAGGLLALGGQGVGWLFAGRLVAGLASGAAFSSGAAWIKELSAADAGARRATVAMTAGFAAGPFVAGALAQWAPAPTVVPYLPQLALVAAAVPLVARLPGGGPRAAAPRRRGRALADPRFRRVVAPLAPWVFAAAAVPLAYLPTLVKHDVGTAALIFGAVVAALTALAGIAVQPLARRLDDPARPRLLAAALGMITAGMLIAAGAAAATSPVLIVLAALVLGAGYGCAQVCGLLEVQRLAPPDRLAAMTAVYQALSYTGFAVPFVLAAVAGTVAPATGLVVLAALAVLTLVLTVRAAVATRQEA